MPQPMGRRGLLAAGAGLTAAAALQTTSQTAAQAAPTAGHLPDLLRFRADGSFTVIQFNDTQDTHLTDKRTIELITKAIAKEDPDFVVLNGDIINGDVETAEQVKQAYNNVIAPIEEAGVAWALNFGNHDEDSVEKTGMTEQKIMEFVRKYPHNLNAREDAISGHSNVMIPVAASKSSRIAAAMWLVDSGRYEQDSIAGQKVEEYTYETVHTDQVMWYVTESQKLERRGGRPVPGLMWLHIPLWELRHMWFGSPTDWTEESHQKALTKHQITDPQRNEREYVAQFNPGLYNAIRERGDVMGVYFGHDHVNTYEGNYFGVRLGYAPGTGYGTYGLGGLQEHHLRGCRVFTLDEAKPGEFTTRNLYARELGVDVANPGNIRLSEPAPLPFR